MIIGAIGLFLVTTVYSKASYFQFIPSFSYQLSVMVVTQSSSLVASESEVQMSGRLFSLRTFQNPSFRKARLVEVITRIEQFIVPGLSRDLKCFHSSQKQNIEVVLTFQTLKKSKFIWRIKLKLCLVFPTQESIFNQLAMLKVNSLFYQILLQSM